MPLSAGPMRVLVVDDHELVRLGVRRLLEQAGSDLPALELHEAATLDAAQQALARQRFEVVLLDLALGEHFALRGLPRLREAAGDARFLVLTSMPESLYAEQALRAGADGYLMKSELGATLVQALRAVMAGEIYLSEAQRRDSLRRIAGRGSDASRPVLSARELEVLRLVAAGRSTREIAEQLNRSVKTIETHKQNLKTKLGADGPAQLMRQGLAWFGEHA
ncbi:MAG: response regulator transcription factor [Rubrivivax sp.]|nr:response regulator transcription factor [Rubrivivax sp.]